jgi:D-alanine-D-alanine ligase
LDFAGAVNRLVEVASARYFGTPEPPKLDTVPKERADQVFSYVTQRRDEIERRLQEWTDVSSHTDDPVGISESVRRANRTFADIGLKPVDTFTDERVAWTWANSKGFEGGTLILCHLDVPADSGMPAQMFRREPEWLYGDGIGSSRAPLVMTEYALRALRSVRSLRRVPLGVLCYTDEGRDARYSAELIQKATGLAKRVLVMRPGNLGDSVITQRRGQRVYRFRVVGDSHVPGRVSSKPEPLRWAWNHLEEISQLTSREKRVSVSVLNLKTESLPRQMPYRITATLLMTYPDAQSADKLEEQMRSKLGKKGPRWELDQISDRPPMKERRSTLQLARKLAQVAEGWEIPFKRESSVWPSVAGLVPAKTACLCGLGPVARDVGTPQEAVLRISLVQRTLLMAEFLAQVE